MDSGDVGNVGLLIQATGEMGCLVSAGSTSRGAPRGAGEAGVGGSAHTAFPPPRGDTVTPHGVQVGAARAAGKSGWSRVGAARTAGKRGWSRVGAARGRCKARMVPSGGSEGRCKARMASAPCERSHP